MLFGKELNSIKMAEFSKGARHAVERAISPFPTVFSKEV